ncbi:hypothetical protein [uncultured Gilvimarinus sp.]|uniref:hypothetical protein n=1 Tax=uncultured Gilvimarinus sp. TaxID=1689143 RepID=UPI0030EF64BD|tara:strand:+ start:3019 stop:3492 length:474 start_codon:yes stop_codon:yes gene_type:complete
MDDEIFIAKYIAGKVDTDDLVEFANKKLASGVYSDHLLNILDETPKVWVPISNYFEKAVIDLGYEIPSFDDAIWVLVKYHITLISKGNVCPAKQFQEMLKDIERFSLHDGIKEYVGDNIGISRMYAWYHEDHCSPEQIDSEIFEESLKWVLEYSEKH